MITRLEKAGKEIVEGPMPFIKERVREVKLLERESRWEEATTEWIAIAETGGGAPFLVRAADAALEAGLKSRAQNLLQQAIDADPTLSEAWFSFGFLLEEQDELANARIALEQGLRLKELQPVLTVLGSVCRRLGDFEAAEGALRRSIALDPEDAEAQYGLGLVLLPAEPSASIDCFRTALGLDSDLPHVHRELGHALWKAGKLEEAEEWFQRAVERDSVDAWALAYLGHLKGLRHLWPAAKEAFSRAVELEPDCGFFWASLGEAQMHHGNFEDAERAYLRGLEVEIDEPRVNAQYGLFLNEKGHLTKARFYLRRAVEIDPQQLAARKALEELDES